MNALGGSDLAPRPIAVPADEALPLVVQSQRARISKEGDNLKIADEEQGETTVRLIEVSDVALSAMSPSPRQRSRRSWSARFQLPFIAMAAGSGA